MPRALPEPGPAGGRHGGRRGGPRAGASGAHLDRDPTGLQRLLLLIKLAHQVSSDAILGGF